MEKSMVIRPGLATVACWYGAAVLGLAALVVATLHLYPDEDYCEGFCPSTPDLVFAAVLLYGLPLLLASLPVAVLTLLAAAAIPALASAS